VAERKWEITGQYENEKVERCVKSAKQKKCEARARSAVKMINCSVNNHKIRGAPKKLLHFRKKSI